MHKHLLTVVCLALIATCPAHAQQVLSNGGGSFENGGTTMTFTVGETVIATFSQPNGIMTQGFNQSLNPELQLLDEAGNLACGGDVLFPTVEPGDNSTVSLSIRNESSTDPLSITALDFSGAPVFSIESPPSLPLAIPAGQEVGLSLRFSPDQADDFMGILSIINTDLDEGTCLVNLSGSAQIVDLPALPLPAILLLGLSVLALGISSLRRL